MRARREAPRHDFQKKMRAAGRAEGRKNAPQGKILSFDILKIMIFQIISTLTIENHVFFSKISDFQISKLGFSMSWESFLIFRFFFLEETSRENIIVENHGFLKNVGFFGDDIFCIHFQDLGKGSRYFICFLTHINFKNIFIIYVKCLQTC